MRVLRTLGPRASALFYSLSIAPALLRQIVAHDESGVADSTPASKALNKTILAANAGMYQPKLSTGCDASWGFERGCGGLEFSLGMRQPRVSPDVALRNIANANTKVVICGDFNIDTNDNHNTKYQQLLLSYDFQNHISSPTMVTQTF